VRKHQAKLHCLLKLIHAFMFRGPLTEHCHIFKSKPNQLRNTIGNLSLWYWALTAQVIEKFALFNLMSPHIPYSTLESNTFSNSIRFVTKFFDDWLSSIEWPIITIVPFIKSNFKLN
jgi:hypothetical protein